MKNLILFILGLVSLTGCGQIQNQGDYRVPLNGSKVSTNSNSEPYQCPGSANVLPVNINGSFSNAINGNLGPNSFTVCTSKTASKSDLFVTAIKSSSSTSSIDICLFPLNQTWSNLQGVTATSANSGSNTLGSTNRLINFCTTIQSVGTAIPIQNLSPTSFNTVAIVQDEDRDQMEACIKNGWGGLCPPYFLGQIR